MTSDRPEPERMVVGSTTPRAAGPPPRKESPCTCAASSRRLSGRDRDGYGRVDADRVQRVRAGSGRCRSDPLPPGRLWRPRSPALACTTFFGDALTVNARTASRSTARGAGRGSPTRTTTASPSWTCGRGRLSVRCRSAGRPTACPGPRDRRGEPAAPRRGCGTPGARTTPTRTPTATTTRTDRAAGGRAGTGRCHMWGAGGALQV